MFRVQTYQAVIKIFFFPLDVQGTQEIVGQENELI